MIFTLISTAIITWSGEYRKIFYTNSVQQWNIRNIMQAISYCYCRRSAGMKRRKKLLRRAWLIFLPASFVFTTISAGRNWKKGILLFVTGVIIMLLNSWVSYHSGESFFSIFLKVLLEPTGWFLVWAAPVRMASAGRAWFFLSRSLAGKKKMKSNLFPA